MDVGTGSLPRSMTLGGVGVDVHKRSDSFAYFFDTKIKSIIENVVIYPNMYMWRVIILVKEHELNVAWDT